MQNSLGIAPTGASDLETNPVFNVVIAYEDFESGKLAKRTYDFLVEHLGHESQFSNQMWKFDVLGIPKLREMAARDATAADIIIISCRGGDELPRPARDWIESWLMEKSDAIALVALFSCDETEARAVRDYLAHVAKRSQLEFFAQPGDWPGKPLGDEALDFQPRSDWDDRTLTTLAGVVQRDIPGPRWGLNE